MKKLLIPRKGCNRHHSHVTAPRLCGSNSTVYPQTGMLHRKRTQREQHYGWIQYQGPGCHASKQTKTCANFQSLAYLVSVALPQGQTMLFEFQQYCSRWYVKSGVITLQGATEGRHWFESGSCENSKIAERGHTRLNPTHGRTYQACGIHVFSA